MLLLLDVLLVSLFTGKCGFIRKTRTKGESSLVTLSSSHELFFLYTVGQNNTCKVKASSSIQEHIDYKHIHEFCIFGLLPLLNFSFFFYTF